MNCRRNAALKKAASACRAQLPRAKAPPRAAAPSERQGPRPGTPANRRGNREPVFACGEGCAGTRGRAGSPGRSSARPAGARAGSRPRRAAGRGKKPPRPRARRTGCGAAKPVQKPKSGQTACKSSSDCGPCARTGRPARSQRRSHPYTIPNNIVTGMLPHVNKNKWKNRRAAHRRGGFSGGGFQSPHPGILSRASGPPCVPEARGQKLLVKPAGSEYSNKDWGAG